MNIPEYIEIRNNEIITNILAPDSDGIKNCFINNVLNGESTLEFSIPSNNEKVKEIEPESEFYINGRIYNILQEDAVDAVMEDDGAIWNKYMAQERWNVLGKEFPKPWISNDPTTPAPAQMAIIIVGGGSNLSGNQYITGSAAHALYAVLQHSSWTMGVCDVEGIHDLELEKVSILEAIKQIQDVWGGYLVWDSINKVVHLRDGDQWQNYTGFQFRYAKNIKGLTRTQSNRLVTRLYCFGENNLSVASVNSGKLYVEDFGYTSAIYEDIYSNPDIHDPEELKQKGIAELALNSKPKYAYTLNVVDLRSLPDYSHEEFDVGDMVDVLNPEMDIDSTVRVMSHRYNVFMPWECEATLGDVNERFVEKLKASFNTTNFIDRTFSSSGAMSGSKLVDGTVFGNSIANAALDASKFNTKQLILAGDVWNDNTPSGGNVQWNSHKLFYGGQVYNIIGQDTDEKYIVWQPSIDEEYYQTYTDEEFELVHLADNEFIIAINNSGLHDIAWYNRPARQFISSAFIADAAIKTAHIEDAAIVNAKIANLAVQSANIADLAVTTLKIGNTAITEDKIASMAVTTSKIDNLAITTAKIDSLAVTNAKINSVSAGKITAGTISATISIDGPSIYAGRYYGLGSTPAYLVVGNRTNLADLALYRGGSLTPAFELYDIIPGIQFRSDGMGFMQFWENNVTALGNWDFGDASVTGVYATFA